MVRYLTRFGAIAFAKFVIFMPLSSAGLVLAGLIGVFSTVHAEEVMLQKAAAQYRQAYQNGYVTSIIHFELNTEPRYMDTPARAVPDFEQGTCSVVFSPDAAAKLGFDHGSRLRFMVFHEMAHCDLYFSLTTIMHFPELSEQANSLLSDLLEIEYLFPHGSRQINGYITYHELYADIKAMALMLNEGAVWEEIEPIWLFRRASLASVIGSHDSEHMLRKVPFLVWEQLLPKDLENTVRTLTDRHIVTSFIENVFAPLHFTASRQLEGSLRTVCSSMLSAWASPREVSFLERRLQEGSNSPKSLWRDVATVMKESDGCNDFIERFFQRRYGKPLEQLQEHDIAITNWLRDMK